MAPLKILHFDTEPGWRGGQGQVATILSHQDQESSQSSGLELGLVALSNGELYSRLFSQLKRTRFFLLESGVSLFQVIRTKNILKEFNPDVVHVHSSRDHTLIFLAMFIYSFKNIKVVVHRRVDYSPSFNFFSRWKYRSPRINSYFCVSEYVRKILIQFGVSENKCVTVHSSVNVNKFANLSSPNECKKILAEEFRFNPSLQEFWICPAALTEQKGHEYLIRAFKIFLEKYRAENVVLLLCGEGDLRVKIHEQILQSHLTQSVFMLGYRKDIAEIMNASEVVVLSSVDEGLGTTLLDAGLLKKVVLATNVGGIPEIVKDKKEGLLVPARNPELMAEAMYLLYKDQELRKIYAEALYNKVCKRFSADSMNKKILQAYEKLN